MKLKDFKGFFNKSTATIISVDNPFGDYYTIKLKPEEGTTWTPGEHAIFQLPDANVEGKKSRSFSVASTQEEGHILLGTRTGKQISSFKEVLINLNEGDKVSMNGPFGWFRVQDNTSPIVLVAGGVGITPIRAILKQLENDTSRPVKVVYASSGEYLFGDELDGIAKNNDQVEVIKTTSSKDTTKALEDLAQQYRNDAWYFASGSQGFIKSMKGIVKSAGIKGKRFINDPFLGY